MYKKQLLVLLSCLIISFSLQAQSDLAASWKLETSDGITKLLLVSGDYFSWTEYQTTTGAFIMTKGGSWETAGKKMLLKFEFHTLDSTQVGEKMILKFKQKNDFLKLGKLGKWTMVKKEQTSPLNHPFLFAGRKRNGELQMRDGDRPRKTMKLLTDTHFQWIAYNTETKQFFGTGGGTYSATDGKYIEQIEFFSRDDSRVGASLEFNFEIIDGAWHHSGLSSKGKPIYEIWKVRE